MLSFSTKLTLAYLIVAIISSKMHLKGNNKFTIFIYYYAKVYNDYF